jgi:hypothetical protein
MIKEKVVDLTTYRTEQPAETTPVKPISNELVTAIQDLIYQLRELGPLNPQKSGTGR